MRRLLLCTLALAPLAGPGQAAAAGDPIMALSDVRAGMQCTGYSVFRGQAIEPFGIEILDVVAPSASGDAEPRILFRVSGENIERTGIARGFSGSPVVCPGADGVQRIAGAASEGVGDYGDQTALATPIEQVIGTPVDPPTGKTPAPKRSARRYAAGDRRWASLLVHRRPLSSPLFVGGLSRPVLADLTRAARAHGVTLRQAPGVPSPAPAFAPFRPGSAVSVSYSSGDISLGALGTVAYVDGDDVWAFGHEFEGAGARSLLLQDAYVSTVVVNPTAPATDASSYKLGGPIHDVGTLTDDGLNAVAGRVGALPDLIPVRVYAEDLDTGKQQDSLLRVADETDVGNPTGISGLAFGAPVAVVQSATRLLGSAPLRTAGQMCFQVRLRERKAPLRFCNRYVSDGLTGASDGSLTTLVGQAAAQDASDALTLLDSFKGRRLHVVETSARIKLTRGQRQAYLRKVQLPRRVRAGADVPAHLVVKVVRGATRRIAFTWHVPRDMRHGKHTLTFRGAEPDGGGDLFDVITVDLADGEDSGRGPDLEGPRNVKGLARAFRQIKRYDGIKLKGSGAHVYRDDVLRIGGSAKARVRVRRPR